MSAIRVLAVVDDGEISQSVANIVKGEGDELETAATIEEAVGKAGTKAFDVAFVELRAEGGAALALCHHLPSLCPGISVQAIVHPAELARGEEALSLGASGVLVSPPTFDAMARVLSSFTDNAPLPPPSSPFLFLLFLFLSPLPLV